MGWSQRTCKRRGCHVEVPDYLAEEYETGLAGPWWYCPDHRMETPMAKPVTRKMSSRHEDDLVALLGGERTRNSGAVWSDQCDGHQTGLDQYWRFGWDGKSTLGKSIGITRDMLTKLREQCRGLEPMLPLRWYRDERLTRVDEDWIAIEAETLAQIVEDANAYRALKDGTHEEYRLVTKEFDTPGDAL